VNKFLYDRKMRKLRKIGFFANSKKQFVYPLFLSFHYSLMVMEYHSLKQNRISDGMCIE